MTRRKGLRHAPPIKGSTPLGKPLGNAVHNAGTRAGELLARGFVFTLRALVLASHRTGRHLLDLATWFVHRPVAIGLAALTLLSGGIGGVAVARNADLAASADDDSTELAALVASLRQQSSAAVPDGFDVRMEVASAASEPVLVTTTTAAPAPAPEPKVAAQAAIRPIRETPAAPIAEQNGSSPLVTWPHNGRITGVYGEHRGSHRHAGIDIDGNTGDAVRAAGPGVVIGAGRLGSGYSGYGIVVLIDHGDGIRTLSAHLSQVSVQVGQQVAAGDIVGAVGSTGHSTGSHLHFEVRRGDQPLPPREWLPAR